MVPYCFGGVTLSCILFPLTLGHVGRNDYICIGSLGDRPSHSGARGCRQSAVTLPFKKKVINTGHIVMVIVWPCPYYCVSLLWCSSVWCLREYKAGWSLLGPHPLMITILRYGFILTWQWE